MAVVSTKRISVIALLVRLSCVSSLSSMTSTKGSSSLVNASSLRKLAIEGARRDEEDSLDVKGILWTEHINLVVGSRELAESFYLDFLGFSNDLGKSFHLNLGQQQLHLAANGDEAQIIAGSIGLAVPSLKTLRDRIPAAAQSLRDTQFSILKDDDKCISVMCPWGNTIHLYGTEDDSIDSFDSSISKMVNLHEQKGLYGSDRIAVRGKPGIRYIQISCQSNQAKAIAKFYRMMLGCTATETMVQTATNESKTAAATVCVGPGVHLLFVESDTLVDNHYEGMKGVHICCYVSDFLGLYRKLEERNLIWTNPRFVHLDSCDTWEEALASRTLRFKDIIDLDTGDKILELEHETRPLRHGQYMKVPFYEPK